MRSSESLKLVDGFKIRQTHDVNFGIIEAHSADMRRYVVTSFIPKEETWIDHQFADETDFLVKFHRMIGGVQGREYVLRRKQIMRKLARKQLPGNFIMDQQSNGKITICVVNGKLVRECRDPEFVFGGHDGIYKYIPPNTVWVDGKTDTREIPFIIGHELDERARMAKGMSYDGAHGFATAREQMLRRKAGGCYPGDENYNRNQLSSKKIIESFYAEQEAPRIV